VPTSRLSVLLAVVMSQVGSDTGVDEDEPVPGLATPLLLELPPPLALPDELPQALIVSAAHAAMAHTACFDLVCIVCSFGNDKQ